MFYQPEPTGCNNKLCKSKGIVPASGNLPGVRKCGSYVTMKDTQFKSGGVSGRGVTPCPFGYLQKVSDNGTSIMFPYENDNFKQLSPSSIFFDPKRPGWLPPLGYPRSLKRVGYEWRN